MKRQSNFIMERCLKSYALFKEWSDGVIAPERAAERDHGKAGGAFIGWKSWFSAVKNSHGRRVHTSHAQMSGDTPLRGGAADWLELGFSRGWISRTRVESDNRWSRRILVILCLHRHTDKSNVKYKVTIKLSRTYSVLYTLCYIGSVREI